jgi:tetratricopeptide (TPR) repeat protein
MPGWPGLPAVLLAILVGVGLPGVAAAQDEDGTAYYEFLLARYLESQGDSRGAQRALERAAAADPLSAEVRAELASFHLRRNERADAETAGQAALVLDPGNVEANRVLGQIYASMAESARPGSADSLRYLRDAIGHFERVVVGSAGVDAQLQFALGRLYMANGEPAKAIQTLARVVDQNPGSAAARLSLAQAYAATADLTRAIATLDEIVEHEPRVASTLGEYFERAGLLTQAADAYTLALGVQPESRELKHRRVAVLYNAKEYDRAAMLAGEAHRQHPDDLRFPRLEARARFDAGQHDAAIAQLEEVAAAFPRDHATQFALIDLYHEGRRDPDAERVLRTILDAEPGNPNALNYLGYLLALRGERLDEAIALVRRALEVDPDNGAYLDSLGWAYFQRGDLDQAEKYLMAAVERLPRHAEVLDHVGDLHARRGRWDEAIEAWTRALDGEGSGIDRDAIQRKIDQARERLPR